MTATGEIVDGKPHIHAVMAVQGDRAITGHLHEAQLDASFARAYVIPSEQHVAVAADEHIVFEKVPDVPAGRGGSTTPESRVRTLRATALLALPKVKPQQKK